MEQKGWRCSSRYRNVGKVSTSCSRRRSTVEEESDEETIYKGNGERKRSHLSSKPDHRPGDLHSSRQAHSLSSFPRFISQPHPCCQLEPDLHSAKRRDKRRGKCGEHIVTLAVSWRGLGTIENPYSHRLDATWCCVHRYMLLQCLLVLGGENFFPRIPRLLAILPRAEGGPMLRRIILHGLVFGERGFNTIELRCSGFRDVTSRS